MSRSVAFLFSDLDEADFRILKIALEASPDWVESKDFDDRTGLSSRSANLSRASKLAERGLIVSQIKPGTENRNKPPYVYSIVSEYKEAIAQKVEGVQCPPPPESSATQIDQVSMQELVDLSQNSDKVAESIPTGNSLVAALEKDLSQKESDLSNARKILQKAQDDVAKLEKVIEYQQGLLEYYHAENS